MNALSAEQNTAGAWWACRAFFDLVMLHDNLEAYYRTNFRLMIDYNISLDILEAMIPFEREVYIALLKEDQEKKKQHGAS